MSEAPLERAVERMRADGIGDAAIRTFEVLWREVRAGATGLIAEADIEPVTQVEALVDLPSDPEAERAALEHAVVIRLNGGLGTSMGLRGAKSLLVAREGRSFLDIIAGQVLALREQHGVELPLLLMDSFSTQADTLRALEAWPQLRVDDLPLDFLQHREPKLLADTLEPVTWPADPRLEWCPPGHGDLYPALVASGLLRQLLDRGVTHAFVANSDNLGAVLEPRVLAWMVREDVPFAMEVVERTEADRKGGHVARRRDDGRLVLRETAQTSPDDVAALRDLTRHRFANTNNLWIDLRALEQVLDANDGVVGLPLIRNAKTVDPTDASSPAVYQLETAMGAAVGSFDGARALLVDRTRFVPVKGTEGLLVLRSDAYRLDEASRLVLDPRRGGRPTIVTLDKAHFAMVDDFEARFPAGTPSLAECGRFTVEGDVRFGAGVVARGDVTVRADGSSQAVVPDGTVLSD
ncbi:MAG: UTP--glucose-phosphate uridylyltransferase [Thermoleophilia bacterium]|nr:UTP--glucose-phosphate uridylyltransferase [Thermoleophilia bacterium]